MTGREFDEVQKKPDAGEKPAERDPFADERLARPELSGAAQLERQGAVEALDLGVDDPLARKELEAKRNELEKYSDLRQAFSSHDQAENFDKQFAQMSPEEREQMVQRVEGYTQALQGYIDSYRKAFAVAE